MLDIVDQGFSVDIVECVGCVDEDDSVGSFVDVLLIFDVFDS